MPTGSPHVDVDDPRLDDIETHRRALIGYCYRMLGSGFEAEDAVQETMVRAWKAIDRFEGRAGLGTWLHRIATNVCLDMLRGRQRRARPMEMGPAADPHDPPGGVLPEHMWVQPIPDAWVVPPDGNPAEVAEAKETIRLAFITALQHLPPKQRAVLILREVLRWKATEVAELLDTSVAAVNSALQRARATLAEGDLDATPVTEVGVHEEELLARYVDTFERYDIAALVALLHEDAVMSMPPYPLWIVGPEQVRTWMLGNGIGCKGSRLRVTSANGRPAVATYRPAGPGRWTPFSIVVLDTAGDKITGLSYFLHTELFPAFGLPSRIDEQPATARLGSGAGHHGRSGPDLRRDGSGAGQSASGPERRAEQTPGL